MKTKGEIATTLSIFAFIVMSLGALIGARQTIRQQRLPNVSAQINPPLAELYVPRHGILTIRKGTYSVTDGVPVFSLEGSFFSGNTIIPGFREILATTESPYITARYGGIKRTYIYPSETRDFQMSFFTRKDYACSSLPINIVVKGPSQNQVGELIVDLQQICLALTPTVQPTVAPTQFPSVVVTTIPTRSPTVSFITPIVIPSVKPSIRPVRPTSPIVPSTYPKPSTGRIKTTATVWYDSTSPVQISSFYLYDYNVKTNTIPSSPIILKDVINGVLNPDGTAKSFENYFENLERNKQYVVLATSLTESRRYPQVIVIPPSSRCLHPKNAPLITLSGSKTQPEDYCIVQATSDGMPGQDFGKTIEFVGEFKLKNRSCNQATYFGNYEFWPRLYTTQYDYGSISDNKDLYYTSFLVKGQENIPLFYPYHEVVEQGVPSCIFTMQFANKTRIYEGDRIAFGFHYIDFLAPNKNHFPQFVPSKNSTCIKPDFGGPYCIYTIPKGGLKLNFSSDDAVPITSGVGVSASRGSGKVAGTITLRGACSNLQPLKSKVTVQLYKEFFDKSKQKYPSRYDIVDRTLILNDASGVTIGNNCKYFYEITNLENNATYAVGVEVQKEIPTGVKLPVQEHTETIPSVASCVRPFIPISFHEDSAKYCKFTAKEIAPIIDFAQ